MTLGRREATFTRTSALRRRQVRISIRHWVNGRRNAFQLDAARDVNGQDNTVAYPGGPTDAPMSEAQGEDRFQALRSAYLRRISRGE